MSGSSPSSGPSKNDSKTQPKFQNVPEKKWLVHFLEDPKDEVHAFGTANLMSCIAVYVRVTEKCFFLAHILDDFTCEEIGGVQDFLGPYAMRLTEVLVEKDDETVKRKMKENLGKKLDQLVEEGKVHNLKMHYTD